MLGQSTKEKEESCKQNHRNAGCKCGLWGKYGRMGECRQEQGEESDLASLKNGSSRSVLESVQRKAPRVASTYGREYTRAKRIMDGMGRQYGRQMSEHTVRGSSTQAGENDWRRTDDMRDQNAKIWGAAGGGIRRAGKGMAAGDGNNYDVEKRRNAQEGATKMRLVA